MKILHASYNKTINSTKNCLVILGWVNKYLQCSYKLYFNENKDLNITVFNTVTLLFNTLYFIHALRALFMLSEIFSLRKRFQLSNKSCIHHFLQFLVWCYFGTQLEQTLWNASPFWILSEGEKLLIFRQVVISSIITPLSREPYHCPCYHQLRPQLASDSSVVDTSATILNFLIQS